MRTKRKPKITKTITIRIEPKLKNELQAMADLQGMSLSGFIRHVLRECARGVSNGMDYQERLDKI